MGFLINYPAVSYFREIIEDIRIIYIKTFYCEHNCDRLV